MNFECLQGGMPEQRDIICERSINLRIQVFNQKNELFKPNKSEVHFYGDNYGEILAFETIGYQNQSEALIKDAINWYAVYLGFPEMKIYSVNPIL